ncbi:hypothetical protein, partial [Gilvibacter sp.]|uniref:hypothetical protein n=1 Tax=Gilvibacter sp. TaxID=2729997 RepID=UPI003F49E522
VSFEINRRDYGVGGRSLVMSKNVTISINLRNSKSLKQQEADVLIVGGGLAGLKCCYRSVRAR